MPMSYNFYKYRTFYFLFLSRLQSLMIIKYKTNTYVKLSKILFPIIFAIGDFTLRKLKNHIKRFLGVFVLSMLTVGLREKTDIALTSS